MSSYESSFFVLNILFLYFLLQGGAGKRMCAGINQLVKMGILTTEEG
jgi:hypothetical protein